MDFSLFGVVVSSVNEAKRLLTGLFSSRLDARVEAALRQVNEALSSAQGALLEHQLLCMDLVNRLATAEDHVRELKRVAAQREQYTLVEIGRGQFAYGLNLSHNRAESVEEDVAKIPHYVCQPCFDSGSLRVLSLFLDAANGPVAQCPTCQQFLRADILQKAGVKRQRFADDFTSQPARRGRGMFD
jgi:hypothetical protein